ncbi:taperin-like [Penaeus indicus]|uniref:taperin-like n=1 Tax=Penaeus indicus TaxID=29960 RepID=UPI00300C6A82
MWRQLGPPRAAVPPPPLTPPAMGSPSPSGSPGVRTPGQKIRTQGLSWAEREHRGQGASLFPGGGTARAGAGRGEGRTNENWPCVGVQKGGFGPAWRRAGTTTPHTTPSPPPPHHATHALPPARPRAARRLGRDHLQHARSAPATRARDEADVGDGRRDPVKTTPSRRGHRTPLVDSEQGCRFCDRQGRTEHFAAEE